MTSEREEYRRDVLYEEYRRGLPEGSLSEERIEDGFWDQVSPESLVNQEAQRQEESWQEAMEWQQIEDDDEWMGGLDWSGEDQ